MCESGSTFIIHAILQLPQSKESSSKETVINVGGKYICCSQTVIHLYNKVTRVRVNNRLWIGRLRSDIPGPLCACSTD